METAKTKIDKCVASYIKLMPDEYAAFRAQLKGHRAGLIDQKYGTTDAGAASSMRAMFEMPETLHDMLVKALTEEEIIWFKAGGDDRKEGARWFANKYAAFRVPEKV